MKKTLRLFNKGFQTSTGKTLEFMTFAKAFKSELKKELESNGAINVQFNTGHLCLSGFYTVGSQAWYFSISDVRFFREAKILYRKADSYKDYTGGTNQYTKIEIGMGNKMIKSQEDE